MSRIDLVWVLGLTLLFLASLPVQRLFPLHKKVKLKEKDK